jgi:hypothetical protein
MRTLEVQGISKPILYDLIAGQFARDQSFSNLAHSAHILYALARNPKLDSQSLAKTVSNAFVLASNAAFYLCSHL